MSLPIAFLLSGGGRTLENLLIHGRELALPVQVVAVASNKAGVRGLDIARAYGLPHEVFPLAQFTDRSERDRRMFAWLDSFAPELFCLGGYLALLDVRAAAGKPVLNIHPALLPAHGGKGCYGDRVHAAVLAAKETRSGATVHLVDEVFDHGAILAQEIVPVLPSDDVHSLAERVFAAECELYPRVLRAVANGKLTVKDGVADWH